MEVIIHFKNYDLACEKIKTTRNVPYKVETHLTKSDENGLLVTIEINDANLDKFMNLIESFGLETY